MRVGRLVVLEKDPVRACSPNGTKHTRWRCRCDCGNETTVFRSQLTNGRTKSCGCWRRELMASLGRQKVRNRKVVDLTGQTFGRLTVLCRAAGNDWGQVMWWCRCQCGKEIEAMGGNLRMGKQVSCGCARVDWGRKLGKRYGGGRS